MGFSEKGKIFSKKLDFYSYLVYGQSSIKKAIAPPELRKNAIA